MVPVCKKNRSSLGKPGGSNGKAEAARWQSLGVPKFDTTLEFNALTLRQEKASFSKTIILGTVRGFAAL